MIVLSLERALEEIQKVCPDAEIKRATRYFPGGELVIKATPNSKAMDLALEEVTANFSNIVGISGSADHRYAKFYKFDLEILK